MLDFEAMKAVPDQLVSYYFWAEDIGPDGGVRRASSDMFFAEVRPFEEIFRQGEQPPAGSAEMEGQENQNAQEAGQVAELQKQIISGSWKLIRRETRSKPTDAFVEDAKTLRDSQKAVLDQAAQLGERLNNPDSKAALEQALTAMKDAGKHLGRGVDGPDTRALQPALTAEQTAYQALLRLRAREFQVTRSRSRQSRSRNSNSRSQRQLNQLELSNDENRFEEQRTARSQQEQTQQQREQAENRQVLNRLRELAQRQRDLNERLKELQAALEAAKTQEAREELQRQLKRLRDQQQEILRDTDELRERMENEENQQRMAEARQQVEQGRENLRQASQALEQGRLPQALTAGARAGEKLDDLREQFRKETANKFSEEMTQLRAEARKLDEDQKKINEQLDAWEQKPERSLRESDERKQVRQSAEQQTKRLDQVLDRMRNTTQEAEDTEPLLAKGLYDAVRQANEQKIPEALKVTQQLVDAGFPGEALKPARIAGKGIEQLRQGIEHAAESVLGDETAALRRAQGELDDLANQVNREIARNQPKANPQGRDGENQPDANAAGAEAQQPGEPGAGTRQPGQAQRKQQGGADRPGQPEQPGDAPGQVDQQGQRPGSRRPGQQGQTKGQRDGQQRQPGEAQQPGQDGDQPNPDQQPGEGQQPGQGQRPGNQQQGQQPGTQQQGQQPGGQQQGQGQGQQPGGQQQGGGGNQSNPGQPGAQPGEGGDPQQRRGQRGGGGGGGGNPDLDRVADAMQNGRGGPGGPITGEGFRQWSDRMRDVEELIEDPEWRAEAARIRDRVRGAREEFRRHSKEPDWTTKYTVDEHTLLTIRNLERLMTDAPPDRERFSSLLWDLAAPELLVLSLLLHDVGKWRDDDHHLESVRMAREMFRRIGLTQEERDTVEFLIANHLAMSQVAFRRDTEDPEIVRKFAGLVGVEERLRMLCLMTLADVEAVSLETLTPWRAELLWRLFVDTYNQLTLGYGDERIEPNRPAAPNCSPNVRRICPRPTSPAFSRVSRDGICSSSTRDAIYRHVRLSRDIRPDEVHLWIEQKGNAWELTVVTLDKPFLFSNISGVLSSFGMDILRGHAMTNPNGLVLDVFQFTDQERFLELNAGAMEQMFTVLNDVVSGRATVTDRLRGREQSLFHRRPMPVTPVVHCDNTSSKRYTIIDIIADDELGLLYRISRVISQNGCDVDLVLIATEGHRAIDVFHITKAGRKLSDAEQLELTAALQQMLEDGYEAN